MNILSFSPRARARRLFGLVLSSGALLLHNAAVVAAAADDDDPSNYFASLTSDEKEDYTNWLADHSSSYSRHEFMKGEEDNGGGAAIFWTIDNDTIHLALAVPATGWVGFGISEAGG